MGLSDAFEAHLKSGDTTVCRCWVVHRADGMSIGFTDHDRDVSFGPYQFRAQSGMSAGTIAQSTGLSVDNTEALGALSDAAITEEDIEAGRYDGARVGAWLVNWANPSENVLLFRGTLGEIRRAGGQFRAELRGMTEALNQPQGRVYQAQCSAVLGDAECGFGLQSLNYNATDAVTGVEDRKVFRFANIQGLPEQWFERGRLEVQDGAAAGLSGVIKRDYLEGSDRIIELWQSVGAEVKLADHVTLYAGCDKRAETCKAKFNNFLNFRGFPHIPGEDWLMSYPVSGSDMDGGTRGS